MCVCQATDVPVGEDNLQNIQIAQHLAAKFNSTFRPFFPRPRVRFVKHFCLSSYLDTDSFIYFCFIIVCLRGSVADPDPESEPVKKIPGAGQKWTGVATLQKQVPVF